MGEIDLDALAPWLGRTETKEDVLTEGLIDKFRATLGPHLWHEAGDVPLGFIGALPLIPCQLPPCQKTAMPREVDFCPLFRCPPACGLAAMLRISRR